MRCPTCKASVDRDASRFVPFCSERCKLIDLGKWLDGSYSLPGEPASEEELAAEMARELGRRRREDS